MEASEKIDQLVQAKKWSELTTEEKTFVVDVLGSEEQFQGLREVHFALTAAKTGNIRPDDVVLKRLKSEFRAKHARTEFSNAFQVRVPAYAAVIVIFLIGSLAWYAGFKSSRPIVTTQVIRQVDTLLLASKPDTVYVDKIIYKAMHVKNTSAVAAVSEVKSQSPEIGVNMKETEALQNLLVSGSE
jgi:hypothetical protein